MGAIKDIILTRL